MSVASEAYWRNGYWRKGKGKNPPEWVPGAIVYPKPESRLSDMVTKSEAQKISKEVKKREKEEKHELDRVNQFLSDYGGANSSQFRKMVLKRARAIGSLEKIQRFINALGARNVPYTLIADVISIRRERFEEITTFGGTVQTFPKPPKAKKIHKCEQCSTQFPTLQGLRIHRSTYHDPVAIYTCEDCGLRISGHDNFISHRRLNHYEPKITRRAKVKQSVITAIVKERKLALDKDI